MNLHLTGENLNLNLDLNDTKKNINKISSEIIRNKETTKLFIEENISSLFLNIDNNKILINDGENIIEEIKNLYADAENETKSQLKLSEMELQEFKEKLHEISFCLEISQKILKIDELFKNLEKAKKTQNILVSMEIIGNLKCLIFDSNDKLLSKLLCYQHIKTKYFTESEILFYLLNQYFEELFQLEEISTLDNKTVTIKISNDEVKLRNIIIGLFNVKYNPTKICNFLLQNVFEPIVKMSVSLEVEENENISEYTKLILRHNLGNSVDKDSPNCNKVLENVLFVLKYLNRINIELLNSICVFHIFGKCMKSGFLDLLINKCLIYHIPDESNDMKNTTFIKNILNFNDILIEYKLLNASDKELLDFTNKVIMLSKSRFDKKCIDEAVNIMQKDLYNMISIKETHFYKIYPFSECMISKSMLELITLLKRIVDEDENNIQVIVSIVNHYIKIVPEYHGEMLKEIPQQTALFYNNSMFFSSWLLFHFNQSQDLKNSSQSLQNLSLEYFKTQVENQNNNLTFILRNFDLSNAVSELGPRPQKIILQCLRQLDLLKNVWQSILPENLYSTTMINFVDEFLKEIIRNIMIIEDISSIVSNELVENINIIEGRIPRLFKEEDQIKQTSIWLKLVQLKQVLSGNLLEITEIWSENISNSTMQFTSEEIRHLVRALFQNTERRANALALIV